MKAISTYRHIDGQATQFVCYMPYGETLVDEHTTVPDPAYLTAYKFNGKEMDAETGLYYYGARYYEPELAMWYGVDTLTEKYPNMGAYVYCANNPVKMVDPDGMECSPYYDEDGNFLGVDENGYAGNVYVVSKDVFDNSMINGVAQSYDFGLRANSKPLQDSKISSESFSKIYTDILIQYNNEYGDVFDKNENMLYNESVSIKNGNIGYNEDYTKMYAFSTDYNTPYDKVRFLSTKNTFNINSMRTEIRVSVNQNTESTKMMLTTVENIVNALGAHE